MFLEFALAGRTARQGAQDHGKELAAREPGRGLARSGCSPCERCAAGLQPSAQMPQDLAELARAAGTDPDTAEGDYLAELLTLPATVRAPRALVGSHRPAWSRSPGATRRSVAGCST